MPLSRFQLRNEYSLADPELYRVVDKDNSDALLEGVAMAGLTGVLRQLGDVADFAAEIFHDLHEEVMSTAARGHSLTVRVQQLEEELPLIEKEFLSRTNHSSFFYNAGTSWHPNLPINQNMITRGDLPRHVMDSYEECRGPPRLFLLDKFDVAGAGACLKRYTDPSLFKVEASNFKITDRDFQRETKPRKAKLKKGPRRRNGKTPELLPTSHAKLHQLLLEERMEIGIEDSVHHVKLKRRLNGFPFDSKTGKSYMEVLLETPSVDQTIVHEVFVDSLSLKLPSSVASETVLDMVETSEVSVSEEVAVGGNEDITWTRNSYPSPPRSEESVALISPNDTLNETANHDESLEFSNQNQNMEAGDTLPTFHNVSTDGEISVDGDRQDTTSGCHSNDISSDTDDYMDAPASMEPELDLESELRPNKDLHFLKNNKYFATNDEQLQSESSFSQSIQNTALSDDENGSSKKEISSSFDSGSSSTSPEMAHLEGEGAAKDFAMAEIQVQMCDSSFDPQTTDDGVVSAQPLEDVVYNDTCIKTAGINRLSSEFGEPITSPSVLDSGSIPGYAGEETIVKKDALTESVRNEIFSTLGESENDYVRVVENAGNPSTSKILDVRERTTDDFPPRVSDENQLPYKSQNQDVIIIDHATSAVNHNSFSSSPRDDTPIPLSTDNEKKYNSDVGHLNQSNNLSLTSNLFSLHSQYSEEPFSDKNLPLDRLNDKGPSFVEDSTCLSNLSDPPSSNEDSRSPSSSVVSHSCDDPDASLDIPNILEVSLEECVKNSLQIVSEEEIADNSHSGASKLDDTPVGSNLSITQPEIKNGSVSESETGNASVKYNASSYMDIKKFQNDSISSFGQFTRNKLQNESLCLPESHNDLAKQNGGHHGIASILDSVLLGIAGYDHPQCEVLASDTDKATSIATEQSVLDMEAKSSSENNLTDANRERLLCENEISPEEMPPLPPLPPVQWRLAKVQLASPAHENSADSFSFPATMHSSNPFLSLPEGYTYSEGNLATNDKIRPQVSYAYSGSTVDSKSAEKEVTQPLNHVAPATSLNDLKLEKHDSSLEANSITNDTLPSPLTVENNEKPLHAVHDSEEEILQSAVADGIVNGSPKVKLPQGRSPPIETVAAFDKSRLRKVTDQVRHQVQKVDERDSLLEMIRTKSFNLKPAVPTRPNIQGPQTNLRVVAILERAKTIRQAFAGTDEDDNEDSWSDS